MSRQQDLASSGCHTNRMLLQHDIAQSECRANRIVCKTLTLPPPNRTPQDSPQYRRQQFPEDTLFRFYLKYLQLGRDHNNFKCLT